MYVITYICEFQTNVECPIKLSEKLMTLSKHGDIMLKTYDVRNQRNYDMNLTPFKKVLQSLR